MKSNFFVGMGLGIAATAAMSMLMDPSKKKDMKKALKTTEQAVDSVVQKIGG